MSNHYSGVDLAFPHGDARLDYCDLFVFPKPGDASKTILIVDVHPSFGINPPGATTTEPFSNDGLYEIMIDTNDDTVPELAYSVRFSAAQGGGQTATVRRIEGTKTERTGQDGQVVIEAPVSPGPDARVTDTGAYRFFAGWRSDPFFFDAQGALNGLQFTGSDFFGDKNVCSIALEVPNAQLGSAKINLWGRTVEGVSGTWVQADRGARPSQEPFLSGDDKAKYLTALPAQDAQFIPTFAHSLEHTGGFTPDEAKRVAQTLLPDMLTYEVGRPASFPSNGRALADDAVDHFLSVITGGKVTSDGVGPHSDLLAEFPYTGPPHAALVTA